MKGFKLTAPSTVKLVDLTENENNNQEVKVRITKALISLKDVIKFSDEENSDSVVLGSSGVGIVSKTDSNLFGLEEGKRVYVEPNKNCEKCYNCLSNEKEKCLNPLSAGDDYDGFLSDFFSTSSDKVFLLPDAVSDENALFVNQISMAISVYDTLEIQKGEYVLVVGGNNFGNIFSQLLIYYQAVPILLTTSIEEKQIAKDSGIYYVLDQDDNWQKEVANITSGRMAGKVVYISDCDIPISKAFSLASFNSSVAYTGALNKSASISFSQAIKKQLNIHCTNSSVGNTPASINLIANKAIDFSHLKLENAPFDKIPETLKKLAKAYQNDGTIHETIVDMINN